MRTKTLLLSAAALVASAIASQAQSNVYSANIVGYATVVLPGNGQYVLVANPFDDGNGNYLTNIVNGNLPKQSQVLTWGGATFNTLQKLAGGWPASTQQLPPGVGFFVRNGGPGSGAPALTNTFVGSIVVPNGGFVTNQVPIGYSLQGSPIPYAGNIAIGGQAGGDTNMDAGSGLTKQSQILTWNSGLQTYATVQKVGSSWGGTATVNVGDGFFINNKNGPATNWWENLNVQ
jgi:hypothetical protein